MITSTKTMAFLAPLPHFLARLSSLRASRWFFLGLSSLAASFTVGLAVPTMAAERITFQLGPIQRSIAVEDLETFAAEGRLENEVGFLLRRFTPARREQIRQALQAPLEGIDPIVLSQFSYTQSGEVLFQEVGEVIQTESGQNGFKSLRGAALLTATQDESFTLLGFLRQLPTDMRVDVAALLRRVRLANTVLAETRAAVAAIEAESGAIATTTPLDLSAFPDLRLAGSTPYSQQTVEFYDAARDRSLTTDLYLPQQPGEIPVIIISNGLGARRDRFQELAQHLASHGFAVVVPDHPGSDRDRLQDFYAGLYRENFEATEYLERPRDISFLLDELTRQQVEDGENGGDRLNLDRVAVFGYSFGGSTALSLAGATLDYDHLQTSCTADNALFNISRLYQCRALELPAATLAEPVADDRITSLYLYFPFGRSLFGETGIGQVKVPVFWQATDLDILTPMLDEHLPTYGWLTTPDRYLAVTRGLPHARITLDVLRQLTPIRDEWPRLREISVAYQNAMTVAFFQTYLAEDERYRPLLHPDYAEALTEDPYPLSLVRSLPPFP